jgi:hypothetical protein
MISFILDKMSIIGYSTCIIQFIRNGTDTPEREYSERSIVELRQLDITAYSIRAIDVENNRTVTESLN